MASQRKRRNKTANARAYQKRQNDADREFRKKYPLERAEVLQPPRRRRHRLTPTGFLLLAFLMLAIAGFLGILFYPDKP